MTRDDVFGTLVDEVLATNADAAQGLTEDKTLTDLGLDSFEVVEIVVGLEDAFDIDILEDDFESLTLGQITDRLLAKINSDEPALLSELSDD